jgi:quinol monooxygenase YgiN
MLHFLAPRGWQAVEQANKRKQVKTMTSVLVSHKVNDFPKWKKAFDEFVDTRKAGGEKSFVVLQEDNNPNDLRLLFQWDNRQNAEKFFASSELKSTMERAGVAGQPKIEYLSEADRGKL